MAGEAWRYALVVDGREIELGDGEVTIGRSRTATVRVDHESVSRSHAMLTFERGNALLKDLNSSNGTYVGGRRVLKETILSDGDRIQLGAAVIGYRLVSPRGPADRTAMIDSKVAAPKADAKPEPDTAPPSELPIEPPGSSPPVSLPMPLEISASELLRGKAMAPDAPDPSVGAVAAEAIAAVKAAAEKAELPKTVPPQLPPPPSPAPPPLAASPGPPPLASAPEGPPPPAVGGGRPAPRPVHIRPAPDPTLSEVPLQMGGGAASARDGALPSAGVLPRIGAALVDGVILLAIDLLLLSPIFLVLFLRGELQGRDAGPDWTLRAIGALCGLLVVAADLWYLVGGWARTGRTPGMSLLGIALVRNGRMPGDGVGLGTAAKRALATILSALPLGLGYLVALFREDGRTWHDLLAGTRVVRAR